MEKFNTDNFLKSLEPMYVEGEWERAIELLRQQEAHLDPGIFHYNLGTLYAKLEEFGAGRYHLERALQEGAPRIDVLNNLDFIMRYIGGNDLTASTYWLDRLIATWFVIPQEVFITVMLLILLLATVSIWRFGRKNTVGLSVLVILSVVPIAADRLWVSRHLTAIVIESVDVLEGPSMIFEKKFTVQSGAKVLVLPSNSPQWMQITRPKAMVGWIRTEQLGILNR
jgi:hypothetical protein